MNQQYIIRVRQIVDTYFLADGEPQQLLKMLDKNEVEDFEFISDKVVSQQVVGYTLATTTKLRELNAI